MFLVFFGGLKVFLSGGGVGVGGWGFFFFFFFFFVKLHVDVCVMLSRNGTDL